MRNLSEFLYPYLKDPNSFSHVIVQAYNADVDAAWEDVWSTGGAPTFLSTAGEHIHVDSDSVEDDPDKGGAVAGTGAHSVEVFYLDVNGVLQHETIATNGTDATISVATDVMFLLKAVVVSSGTGKSNAGTILIKNAGETATFATIAVGESRSFNGFYRVPVGYRLDITSIKASSCILATGAISLSYLRLLIENWEQDAGTLVTTNCPHLVGSVVGSEPAIEFAKPIQVPAGKVIRIQAYGAAANNYVSVLLEGFLVKV